MDFAENLIVGDYFASQPIKKRLRDIIEIGPAFPSGLLKNQMI